MLKTAFEKLFQIRESASRARPGADEGFDAHEKPFLDHLEDLRTTLMKIGATLAISTVLCFTFHVQLLELVQIPAKLKISEVAPGVPLSEKLDLITLGPPEFIILTLKLSFFSAVIISFPFTLYFLFQFILPGLRQVEKKTIIPGAAVGFVLFLVGVCFAFFLAAPVALKFFYVFENERISNLDPTKKAMERSIGEIALIGLDGERIAPVGQEKEPEEEPTEEVAQPKPSLTPEMKEEINVYLRNSFATVEKSNFALRYDDERNKIVIVESKGGKSIYRIGEYITFIARLVLVFGISFQLPVVVSILVKLELLTARVMRATRTYAWIIILVSAAILTPPDLMTLTLLGGPMIFLYEICIIIASIIERRREKRQAAEEDARRSRLEQLYMKPADDLTEEEKAEMHRAEIEQYEREHAHLYENEDHHPHGDDDGDSDRISRDSFHGDDASQHDESWHDDDHHWHDGHEDDPHHGQYGEYHDHDGERIPVQDWPDKEDEGMESDHAEPVDLEPGEDGESEKSDDSNKDDSESPESDANSTKEDEYDEEPCEPTGPIVDLNHASMVELLSLPGVEEELAQMIIDHRPYETFADLDIVPGLTDEMVNEMIDRLMLG